LRHAIRCGSLFAQYAEQAVRCVSLIPARVKSDSPKKAGKCKGSRFFETKNQKTFICYGHYLIGQFGAGGLAQEVKVFCFFFSKKEMLPFLCWRVSFLRGLI
jgi:hypothetical protein